MPAAVKHLANFKKSSSLSLLARWSDGLYYTGNVIKCDKTNKKCLVRFEDSTEHWMDNRELHLQLTNDHLNTDDDIVCCCCNDGQSDEPNKIVICDVCQQGYHQKCHQPEIVSAKIDGDDGVERGEWSCQTCTYILEQMSPTKRSRKMYSSTPKVVKSTPAKNKSSVKKTKLKVRQAPPNRIKLPKSRAPTAPVVEPRPVPPSDAPQTKEETVEPVATGQIIQNNHADADTSSDESEPVRQLPDGRTVEKMPPAVIDAAMAIVEKENDNIATSEMRNEIDDGHGSEGSPDEVVVIKKRTDGKKIKSRKAKKADEPKAA